MLTGAVAVSVLRLPSASRARARMYACSWRICSSLNMAKLGMPFSISAPLSSTGDDTLVDLCSGSGGPALTIARLVGAERGAPVRVMLTDLYPNLPRLELLRDEEGAHVDFSREPVNAITAVSGCSTNAAPTISPLPGR